MSRVLSKTPNLLQRLEASLLYRNKKIKELRKYAEIGKISSGLFHDLLNPISGLALYLETVADKKITNPIIESGEMIRNLIKTIQKDLSVEKTSSIDISEVVNQVIKLLAYKSTKNNVSIQFIRTEKITLNSKFIYIYQVLINLISNAIDSFENLNFDNKKVVSITLEKTCKEISLTISDNGCGIDKETFKNIFNPFYTTKSNGTGLGLATVKDVVENQLGGKIGVESKEGVGTKFRIHVDIK